MSIMNEIDACELHYANHGCMADTTHSPVNPAPFDLDGFRLLLP